MSVVKAMKAAGLRINLETAYRRLEEVVNEKGPDDTRHFDTLLEPCPPVDLQATCAKFMISQFACEGVRHDKGGSDYAR
jgi:hypothetical protein